MELVDKEENKKNLIIEIKPAVQTLPPKTIGRKRKTVLNESLIYQKNLDKWNAAREFAKKIGWEFIILTERELGIR